MRKKIVAPGSAVSLIAGSVMSVYADVNVEGVSTTNISNTGSVSVEGNVSGSGTAMMNDGGTVTVKGDISADNPNTPTRPTESSNQAEGICNMGGGKVTVDGNANSAHFKEQILEDLPDIIEYYDSTLPVKLQTHTGLQ